MKTLITTKTASLFGAIVIASFANIGGANAEASICWQETIDGVTNTVCQSISSLKVECPLTDPENTTDVCAAATIPMTIDPDTVKPDRLTSTDLKRPKRRVAKGRFRVRRTTHR